MTWDDLPEPTDEDQRDPWSYLERHKALIQSLIADDINRPTALQTVLGREPAADYSYYMTPPASITSAPPMVWTLKGLVVRHMVKQARSRRQDIL